MQLISSDRDLLWASRTFNLIYFFLLFFWVCSFIFLRETPAPACHLESPTRFTRKRSPWCKRPSEKPIRRIFWRLLWGWGWGHRNLLPLSGSHLNYSPIHSSPHWYAEPRWRRASAHQNLIKSTTSRWDRVDSRKSCQLLRLQIVSFNFITMCGQRAASSASLVGDGSRGGGWGCVCVTEWERGWKTELFWSVQWASIKRKSVGWSVDHCC